MSRKPLNLVEKWCAMKRAANCQQDGTRLKPMAIVVLVRLLDHQNPKTGQCNPSITRLARDIGVGKRTIYYAIETLEKGCFIRKVKKVGCSNNYLVLRQSEAKAALQNTAESAANSGTKPLQEPAPKKNKKKKKEKGPSSAIDEQNADDAPSSEQMQSAERKIVSALENLGIEYEDMIRVSTDVLIEELEQVAMGKKTAVAAAFQLQAELKRGKNF